METCKPGWVRKVQANLVLCIVPDAGVLYFFNGPVLKRLCEMWLNDKAYPEGAAQNKGYRGIGLCVPFADLCANCAWYFDGVRNKLKFNQEDL